MFFFSIQRSGMCVFISLLALLGRKNPSSTSSQVFLWKWWLASSIRYLETTWIPLFKWVEKEIWHEFSKQDSHTTQNHLAVLCAFFHLLPLQEAAELFQDPDGRWFSFSISMDSVVVLDKKDLPSHLASLPCVESPTSLKDLFLQLEDSGEVCMGYVTKMLRHQSSMFKRISWFKR